MPFQPIAGLPPGKKITSMVDYDNVSVNWNRYELANGITLSVTSLPAAIFATDMTDPMGKPLYIVAWNNVVRITAPENLTGTPTPMPVPDQMRRLPTTAVKPITSDEPWNEFALKDGHTLKARVIVTEIRRVQNMFDPTGMPLFIVNSQQVLDISETEASARE